MENNQHQLVDLMVKNILKKHNVKNKLTQLEPKEKEKIQKIVSNIQNEVNSFLDNK